MSGGKAHGKNRPYQEACRNVLTFRHPKLTPWEGDGIDVPFALPDTQWTCDIALRDDVGALVVALSQNCLFEAKSENREWEKQGLASPNFPVFGNGVPVQSMQKVPISCARKIKGLEEQAGYFAKQINGLLPL